MDLLAVTQCHWAFCETVSEDTAAALHALIRAMQTASMPLAAQQKPVLTLASLSLPHL